MLFEIAFIKAAGVDENQMNSFLSADGIDLSPSWLPRITNRQDYIRESVISRLNQQLFKDIPF